MSGSPSSYRDRIYIVKDVILKLVEYGELNQTALVSFCGLNLKKHKSILEDIEDNGLIQRREVTLGKRTITMYRPTQKGIEFCRDILEPYEKMFPRRKEEEENNKREEHLTGNNEKKNLNRGSLMLVLI
jgi:predicted transcriptional regulator